MAKMTKKKHSTGSGFTNKQRLKSPFSSISNMKMKSSSKKLSKKPLVKASKSAKKSREVVALEQQVKLMQEKLVKIERNQRRLQSSVEQSLEKSDKVKGRGQSTSGELEDEASRPSTSRLSTTKRKRKSDNVEDHSGTRAHKVAYIHVGEGGERDSRLKLSKTRRAGLVMPVAKVLNGLKKGRYAPRVKVDAAVYMAASLEYVVAEVLELAGNCSKYMKRKRITPRHIQMTFLHDAELGELTKGVIVPDGGVKPNILKELLPPHQQMKTNDDADDSEAIQRAASTDVSTC